MPTRLLRDSICTSDSIKELSFFEEVVFYRLIVNADDYGRFDGRPEILKGRLFPLKSGVTAGQIQNAIRKLCETSTLFVYNVDGKPYIQLTNWEKYQRVRNTVPKYPEPSKESILPQSAADCRNLPQSAALIQHPVSSIQYPVSSIHNPNIAPAKADEQSPFERFWKVYPKKKAKIEAEKAWNKINPSSELTDRIVKAVIEQRQSHDWTKEGGKFIPYPATWLNRGEWENEEVSIPQQPKKKIGDMETDVNFKRGSFTVPGKSKDELREFMQNKRKQDQETKDLIGKLGEIYGE